MLTIRPPRIPRNPVDDQPIDPSVYIPDFHESNPHEFKQDLETELRDMEDYEDPTIIEDWLLPYRPKQ